MGPLRASTALTPEPSCNTQYHIKSFSSQSSDLKQEPFPACSKTGLHKTNPPASYTVCATFGRNLPRSVQSCLFDVHEHPWRDQLIQPHKIQFWWIKKLSNTDTTEKDHTVLHLRTTHYSISFWRSKCTVSLGTLKWHGWVWCSQQYFKYCKFCVFYSESFGTATLSLPTLWLQWRGFTARDCRWQETGMAFIKEKSGQTPVFIWKAVLTS